MQGFSAANVLINAYLLGVAVILKSILSIRIDLPELKLVCYMMTNKH